MRKLLLKEMRLSASPLSYWFILFGLMFLLPGYPILCGVFFVTLGIFQSFQSAREANDVVFSALLPVAKKDSVKSKYLFVCLIELCALLLMMGAVLLRMTVFGTAAVYQQNALMNANFFALGIALTLFGLFNLIFVGGFYRTAYHFARPFLTYIIAAFLTIFLAEAVHFFPGGIKFNAFGTEHFALQLASFSAGLILYILLSLVSMKNAIRNFEKIDL